MIDEALDELPAELLEQSICFVKGDPSREAILAKANVSESKIIGIRRNDQNHILPETDFVVQEGDQAIVIATQRKS